MVGKVLNLWKSYGIVIHRRTIYRLAAIEKKKGNEDELKRKKFSDTEGLYKRRDHISA
jgi:hypothetical protein